MGKGILEVLLMDARGLKDTEVIGKIDPYVVIQYRTQERKSSVARGEGTSPVWNETFKFVVHNPGGADSQQKLVFRIMDKDTFSNDDFVGEAMVNVADLITLGMENGIAELRPTRYRVVIPNRAYCGEIQFGVKFTQTKVQEEEVEEEVGGWKHSFHH